MRLEAARVSGSSTTRRLTNPYNLNSRPASLLDCQREGSFEARLGLLQQQERLVRPLRLAIVLGRQEQLQRVGGSEGDWFRERGLLAKPAREKTLSALHILTRFTHWAQWRVVRTSP